MKHLKHSDKKRCSGAAVLAACLLFSALTPVRALADSGWKTQPPAIDVSRVLLPQEADRLIVVEAHGTECRVSLYARCVDEAVGVPAGEGGAAQSTQNASASQNTEQTQHKTPPHIDKTQVENREIGPGAPLMPDYQNTEAPAETASNEAAQTAGETGTDTLCSWTELLHTTGTLGAKGIGKTKEGDKKTPQGLFSVSDFAFGNADAPEGCALPYRKVGANDYWVGDSNSPYYDQLVDATQVPAFDKDSSEHLIDYGRYYNYCLNIEYNKEHTPYKGSALFLHCNRADWSTETTSGCISINQDVMAEILRNVTADTYLLCDTAENFPLYYQK